MQDVRGGPRRRLPPQGIDQPVDSHDPADIQGEQGEQGSTSGASQGQRTAIVFDLERAEDPEPQHPFTLALAKPWSIAH